MIFVTALDAGFVELTCVLLASLSEENHQLISQIYILENGISDADREKLKLSSHRRLTFVDVSERLGTVFAPLYSKKRVTISAFSRYFIPDIIGHSNERVLYLDGDTVVLRSLLELERLDLTGHAVAAAETTYRSVPKWRSELGISAGVPFLNSGVMLINPVEWRRQNITERLIAFLQTHEGPQRFVDQGALNAVLAGQFLRLPPKWNMREKDFRCLSDRANDGHILHFAGSYKPNIAGCDHPGTAYFLACRQRTPFRDAPLLDPGNKKRHNAFKRFEIFVRRVVGEARFWTGLSRGRSGRPRNKAAGDWDGGATRQA